MEVSSVNFKREGLGLLQKSIAEADFVAIDMEMSGLCSGPETDVHALDMLQERWSKTVDSANNFAVLQFGICTFRWVEDGEEEEVKEGEETKHGKRAKLVAEPFNCWIYPKSSDSIPNSDVRLKFQTSSVEFLNGYEFDFNKTFREGIPYLNELQGGIARKEFDARLQAKLEQSKIHEQRRDNASELIDTTKLKDYIREYLTEAMSKAQALCVSQENSRRGGGTKFHRNANGDEYVVLSSGNGFMRRLVYQEIPRHYPLVHVSNDLEDNPKDGTSRKGQAKLRLTFSKTSRDEQEKVRLAEQASKEKEIIEDQIGFGHVIQALKNAKKPIIGHNMLLDMAHMYGKFVQPLENDLGKFKRAFHDAFPVVIDTKHFFQEQVKLRLFVPQTSLGDCFQTTSTDAVFKGKNPDISLPEKFARYAGEEETLHHEAGYDAYMTGIIFARAMCCLDLENHVYDLNLRKFVNKFHENSHTEIDTSLSSIVNKVYLMRLPTTMDLSNPNVLELDRSKYVRLCNFPKDTKTNQLRRLLASEIPSMSPNSIRIVWDNDHSAFFEAPDLVTIEHLVSCWQKQRDLNDIGRITDSFMEKNEMSFADLDIVSYNDWFAHAKDDSLPFLKNTNKKRKISTSSHPEPTTPSHKRHKTSKGCTIM